MNRLTKDMQEVIADLYESVDCDCETCCDLCPYADACGADELFWSCGVWEDSMGWDL